jgi:hypothetical protein
MSTSATKVGAAGQLDLFGNRPSRAPYWDWADTADAGGSLRARRGHEVDAFITASASKGGWTGSWDLGIGDDVASGSTRPQPSRGDALLSAADGLYRRCKAERSAKRAARELEHWLQGLDLL